jgi:hypothetical protein
VSRLLERMQGFLLAAAVAGLAIGFLASIGLRIFPLLDRTGFWIVVTLLLLAGAGGGVATVVRAREIDRRRWEAVDDPLITSGEREYAHKEAERERRWAGIVFFTSPIALGYCAAYHLGPGAVANAPALLALLPLAAYLVGYVAAHAVQRVLLKASS